MVIPEKTYSSNPFVDNIIYYAKLIAMNCSIKDEEEALKNETKESLENGDILISCIECNSKYEMFKSIPKEILEKYISTDSNLNLYVNDVENLKIHLNSYDLYTKNEIYNNISRIAREVYIDHFNIMVNYINTIGISWAEDNLELYNNCLDNTATYQDLFDLIPKFTRKRIVARYLNNYDNADLDIICDSLTVFRQYIDTRTDIQIDNELSNISKAMREVFISHYDIMVERGFVRSANEVMHTYINSPYMYNRCKDDTATFILLYNVFPKDAISSILKATFNEDDIETYNLEDSLSNIVDYITNYSNDNAYNQLDRLAMDMYLENYQSYLNYDIYYSCIAGSIEYYDLIQYLPKETQKMILNTQIEEYTNIKVYSENKNMLDSYLNSIPKEQADSIRYNINMDMRKWYPLHHNELNNYYRTFAGLPPVDSNGNVYEDTLIHSWDENSKSFKEFGDKFIKQITPSIYPDIHWKQNIYEFDAYDIGILNQKGILDDYIAACGYTINDPRYKYIKYLADNKLDVYQCRKALKFQLMGIPTIDDEDARKRFVDSYTVNRDYCIRTVYSDAHKFQSDYYDKFMIIFILINTIIDMLSDITTMIIDREVFDSRCIKWLFESFGVPYYSEIPVKYLRAMLKNLNILLKYKSSTKNMIDICKLFGFSDVRVFGYYLFRERAKDSYSGEYEFDENNDISYDLDKLWVKIYKDQITGSNLSSSETSDSSIVQDYSGIYFMKLLDYQHYDNNTYTKLVKYEDDNGNIKTKRIIKNSSDVYIKDSEYNCFIPLKDTDYFTKIKANTKPAELKFIKVPVDESLAEYKNDPNYIISYDEITYADEGNTWDGGRIHEELYQKLVDYEFNAVKTKYISVETVTDLTEQSFQVSYFYNMLFDNLYSEDALTVKIPYLKIGHEFRFMDIICYLFSLMYFYNDLEDNIMYSPTQILYVKGYNFNEALNEILNDPNAFNQEQDISIRDNIFDVNKQILENEYDYRKAFNNYKIKGFNLEADIDEIELWLNNYCKMSLDDFIVDDSLINFDQIITLRQFFSLNNSYYQKDIFKDNISALPFNQIIKYAYGIDLYKKIFESDYDNITHEYVQESNYYMNIINSTNSDIYVIDYNTYITMPDNINHSLYYKYTRDDDTQNYNLSSLDYFFYNDESDEYEKIFDNNIYIVDSSNRCIFSTDAIYHKNSTTNEYIEVTDSRYFITNNNKKYLMFGSYWIKNSDGLWILDSSKAYVLVTVNGESNYVKYSEASAHQNIVVSEDDCWVKHSDGHFIPLKDTDYYRTSHSTESEEADIGNKIYEFNEEICYVISSTITSERDYDENGHTRFFTKLTDFYNENNWIYNNDLYIYDSINDIYIPESDLLSPNNCYFKLSNGSYDLVVNNYATYNTYKSSKNINYLLILQTDNDYIKYNYSSNSYTPVIDTQRRYVLNSDTDYITVLYKQNTYDETKSLVVIFNKEITSSNTNNLILINKYNPELTDGVWDENDWFYENKESSMSGYDIGMHGENIWYYRKPGSELIIENDDTESNPVGSGFYMESTAYIGDTKLVEGEKYYMAFDLETNFTGKIQIYNEADNSVSEITDKIYEVCKGEKQHISQVFIANENETPNIKFLIYDFDNYPIKIGDYIIVSNIRFIKAYSENFIAQDIPSYDKIQELYKTNEAIYKYLVNLMAKESDLYKYNIYKKIYDSLMISRYNKEAFKIGDNKYAKTYTEFLENRDAILYAKLCRFKELDTDTMHKEIADEIIEVTYAIDDCVDTYSYGFLYSYFPAVSANYIQQYITKLINWFKSWKVHLLGINTVYKLGDTFENTVKILEDQQYRNKYNNIKCNVYMHDTIKINPLEDSNISGNLYDDLYEFDKYTQSHNDCVNPKDRVRIISTTANSIEYQDSATELHLIFNDFDTIAEVVNNNNMKLSSTSAGFSTSDDNQLNMSTDEDEQQVIIGQIIDEINLYSRDYVDWRSILDE